MFSEVEHFFFTSFSKYVMHKIYIVQYLNKKLLLFTVFLLSNKLQDTSYCGTFVLDS